jgi:hypothetical protein
MQDGADIYSNLSFIYRYFEDFFDLDPDAFDNAVVNAEGLEAIMQTAFSRQFPLRNRNTGLSIKEMKIATDCDFTEIGHHELIRVVVINNNNEEIIYYLTFAAGENDESISRHFEWLH